MSEMISEKHSNGNGSAQKSCIIKCKYFMQGHAAWGVKGVATQKQGASFPLVRTMELLGELLESIVKRAVPYK